MRKILVLWAVLASLVSQGQTVSVPTKEYLDQQLRRIDRKIDSLTVRSWILSAEVDSLIKKVGGVVVPPPVITPLDSCIRGPVIDGISKITSTGAVLRFDAFNVPKINYVILSESGDRMLYSDSLVGLTTNTVPFKYNPLANGSYYLRITGRNCVSKPSTRKFTVATDGGSLPPPDPGPVPGKATIKGAEWVKVADRFYSYAETPVLKLAFNSDGTLSDVTDGLDNSGPVTKWLGWNVFYMKGYAFHENADGSYAKFQNVKLPDGIHTVRQFICNSDKIPDYAAFKKYLTDNGDKGVHQRNANMSQLTLTIKSDTKVGNGIGRDWLVVSRTLNFPKSLPPIDWAPYNKYFAVAYINRGDDQATYQRVGAIPYVNPHSPIYQGGTWMTVKTAQGFIFDRQGAYNYGREWAKYMGSSPRSFITEELIENGQGQYDQRNPDGSEKTMPSYEVTRYFAKGNYDVIHEKTGIADKKQMGIYGGYGGDDFYGLNTLYHFLKGSRKDYESSLTDKIYKGLHYNGGGTYGFSTEDHQYYTQDHIGVRNLNFKYYFWNKPYFLPYEFLYLKEKFALATKTYKGIDRESGINIFSTDIVESFVMDNNGGKINIEQASSGELIYYPGGVLRTRMNTQPPPPADEMFTASFWSHVLLNGIAVWDAPGNNFGSDSTKIDWWSDQKIEWKPNGSRDFQNYVSGQNGAPINSPDGLKNTLWAPVIDAAAAGMEAAWEIRDRIQKLSYVSYTSNRGDFIAQPGQAGFHVNGYGAPNFRSFALRDAFDQHKGLALIGEGNGGVVLIYYNGFLPAHLTERVKIRYAGVEYDMGEVYGHQTVAKRI